jgi:hypothetical protein
MSPINNLQADTGNVEFYITNQRENRCQLPIITKQYLYLLYRLTYRNGFSRGAPGRKASPGKWKNSFECQ